MKEVYLVSIKKESIPWLIYCQTCEIMHIDINKQLYQETKFVFQTRSMRTDSHCKYIGMKSFEV